MLPHHIPNPSTDLLIFLTIGLMVTYGFIGGAAKVTRIAISIYVGLVLAMYFGPTVFHSISQGKNHGPLGFTQTGVNIALLAIPVAVLQLGKHHHGPHSPHRANGLVTAILAVLTALLLIASVQTQLTHNELFGIQRDSNLATQIYLMRLVWLATVPAAIAALAIHRPKPKHH